MHCGPPAEISEESIERITKQASVKILKDCTQVPDDLNLISRLAVAATGGHVAVEDGFFFLCLKTVLSLQRKAQGRWKSKVDDTKGTRRNVYWDASTLMLRVRDDRGVGVPLVPLTVSVRVNKTSKKHLVEQDVPFFRKQQLQERVFDVPPPPPVVNCSDPYHRQRRVRQTPQK